MANSEFSADAGKKHQETVVGALKVICLYVCVLSLYLDLKVLYINQTLINEISIDYLD